MRSFSRNHYLPGPLPRSTGPTGVSEKSPTGATATTKNVQPDEGRLWSFQQPLLPVDSYTLSIKQTVEIPKAGGGGSSHDLPLADQHFRVSAPKFSLSDPESDIHSVYPAPGQSSPARTLAHVVFSQPTTPWERDLRGGQAVGSNRLPWLAVLTFAEDELITSRAQAIAAGLANDDDDQCTDHGTIVTRAGRLQISAHIVTALTGSPPPALDFTAEDQVAILPLRRELCQSILATSGVVNLETFAMMAHVKQSHGDSMARSFMETQSAFTMDAPTDPKFSVVVSLRTGPPNVTAPTRVVSHLVSLEGLENIDLAHHSSALYVGLVSLHAWDWMCMPEAEADFQDIMIGLGKSVKPLRVDDATVPQVSGPSGEWLTKKLDAGYGLKPHTLLDGSRSVSLMRGPLIPVRPARAKVQAFSLNGEGLTLIDSKTGLADITYTSAWNLGRSLVVGSSSLTVSIARLRGRIHGDAVKRAKAKSVGGSTSVADDSGSGKDRMDVGSYLSSLDNSLRQLTAAQNLDGLKGTDRNALNRWYHGPDDKSQVPVVRLSDTPYSLTTYLNQIDDVTAEHFGYEYKDADGRLQPAKEHIDADAAAVRAWVLDKFYLADVPLHLLVPHASMLPHESIRTFCVDDRWIDSVVDGGLSVANHFARGDDGIRRAIKDCINKYLASYSEGPDAASGGSGGSSSPQLTFKVPRWGFFLRSVAVTAFPDLRIEIHFKDGRETPLYIQAVADDILLCLFDRLPGEGGFEIVRIYQPHHQQGFSIGNRLDGDRLQTAFRPIPTTSGRSDINIIKPAVFTWERHLHPEHEGYDWENRLLRPVPYMKTCSQVIRSSCQDQIAEGKIYTWPDDNSPPSSVLALQLGTPLLNLFLKLATIDVPSPSGDSGIAHDDQKLPPGQLHVAPRPDLVAPDGSEDNVDTQVSMTASNSAKEQAPPPFVRLPTGPAKDLDARGKLIALFGGRSQRVTDSDLSFQNAIRAYEIEKLKSPLLGHRRRPTKISIFPSYQVTRNPPSNKTIYAIAAPLDLVFTLESPEAKQQSALAFPSKLEIRVPVVLDKGWNPAGVSEEDGTEGALLRVRGTLSAPRFPGIEPLDQFRQHWAYGVRLAQGHSYAAPEDMGSDNDDRDGDDAEPVGPVAAACVMLVITATWRGDVTPPPVDGSIHASFMLRNVEMVVPGLDSAGENRGSDTSRGAQVDVLWYDGDDGVEAANDSDKTPAPNKVPASVACVHEKILRARLVNIADEGSFYHWNQESLSLRLRMSVALTAKQAVQIQWQLQSSGLTKRAILDLGPVEHDGEGTGVLVNTKLGIPQADVPQTVSLAVVQAGACDDDLGAIGPETAPWLIPRVPNTEFSPILQWDVAGERLDITWTAPRRDTAPLAMVFTVLDTRNDNVATPVRLCRSPAEHKVSVPLSSIELFLGFNDRQLRIREEMDFDHKRIIGQFKRKDRVFYKLPGIEPKSSLSVTQLELSKDAQLEAPWKQARKTLASCTCWTRDWTTSRFQISQELWYWAGRRTLATVQIVRAGEKDEGFQYNSTKTSSVRHMVALHETEVAAAGPLHVIACLTLPEGKAWKERRVVWIGIDGSVRMSVFRDQDVPASHTGTVTLEPAGSAGLAGGTGALAIALRGMQRNVYKNLSMVFWVGPEGQIFARGLWDPEEPDEYSEEPVPGGVVIPPTEPLQVVAPPGSIDMTTEAGSAPVLYATRSLSIEKEAFVYWVDRATGDIMRGCARTQRYDRSGTNVIVAVPGARASPYRGLVATQTGVLDPTKLEDKYSDWHQIFWVADDCSVCTAAAPPHNTDYRGAFGKARLSPPGSAHPRTTLAFSELESSFVKLLCWFDPQGGLRAIFRPQVWKDKVSIIDTGWPLLAFSGCQTDVQTGGDLSGGPGLAVAAVLAQGIFYNIVDTQKVHDIFWFARDGTLRNYGVRVSP